MELIPFFGCYINALIGSVELNVSLKQLALWKSKQKTKMLLKFVYLFSTVVLMCAGFGEATAPWDRVQYWHLDRVNKQYKSPGYFVLSVDKTAFTVDYPMWLLQFDVPQMYTYDPSKEVPTEDVNVKYQIVEILKEPSREEIIFQGHIALNSIHEAHVNTTRHDTGIWLKPGFTYEIRVEIPQGKQLMYNQVLDIKEFSTRRFWINYIHVKFYQANPASKPPNDSDKLRKLSNGMVKRLHLKYLMY